MCATFDDGTSKSHCWKINSLFSLILICGQVDLFIFYFHFIVIFILYFYFYFCHRWRWCLFKKELFLVDLFHLKKMQQMYYVFDASELIRIGIICIFDGSFFFGIHCQRKNVCLQFSKKNMKVEVVVVYSKNNFCTSCRKPRPSIHYHTLSWQPKRLLGFANDDDDDDETTCSTSIFRKCDMIKKTDAQRGLAFLDFATCASL